MNIYREIACRNAKRAFGCFLMAMMVFSSACAEKARFSNREDYMTHLASHEGDLQVQCTGNYVKVWDEPGGDQLIGHLEKADQFEIIGMSGKWAQIVVHQADQTSPDSRNGMSGWMNAEYIDCGCSESEYDMNTSSDGVNLEFHSYEDVLNAYQYALLNRQSEYAEKLFVEPYWVEDDVGYLFRDVNQDGTDELFIMDRPNGYGYGEGSIYAVYALKNGIPFRVAEGWDRSRLYLLNDGTLLNEGSDGAAYSVNFLYTIDGDGLKYCEGYASSDYQLNQTMEWGWFLSADGHYTDDINYLVDEKEVERWSKKKHEAVITDSTGWHSLTTWHRE